MRQFGELLACVANGFHPSALNERRGMAQKVASSDVPGRLLLRMATRCMELCGSDRGAPYFHLKKVASRPEWDAHSREVFRLVASAIQNTDSQTKQASMVPSLLGLGARVGVYGAGIAGGLGGYLYWLANRDSREGTAEMEAMKQQIAYYDELNRELNESLRRKYRYEPGSSERVSGNLHGGGAVG